MQERAIVYFVVAYLAGWLIDLIGFVARGPLLESVLKLIIVALCLAVVLLGLARARWLLP